MRFLLNLRMLKIEDQKYKSQHLTLVTALTSGAVSSSASFGILTGVEDFLDQFELDDVGRGEMPGVVLGMTCQAHRKPREPHDRQEYS